MDLSSSNRDILRRLDWRFLLPRPPAGSFRLFSLPGATDALVQQAAGLGLAEVVSGRLPGRGEADGAAVLAGSRVSLEQAAAAIQPGGVLTYEVDRLRPEQRTLSPARMIRSLRGSGLSPLGFYAVRPKLEAAELYLPLDVPQALRWYVETLYIAASPGQRLAEAALRAATGLDGRRFARLAPYYVVVAVKGSAEGLLPGVLELVRSKLEAADYMPLLLTDGGNRVTVLPFARNDAQPLLVLKVPKLPSFNGRTENEQEALRALQNTLDRPLQDTVPQPLGVVRHGEISMSLESYCPGRSLLRASSRWGDSLTGKIQALQRAAEWLADFHCQQLISAETAWRQHWIEDPISAYTNLFGITPAEEKLFAAAHDYGDCLAAALHPPMLPLVQIHRDFNIWNLYQSGERLYVIDWEGARPGPPLCDLLHFVTYWYLAVTGRKSVAGHQQGFVDLFFGSGRNKPAGRAAHQALAGYMDRLALDHRLLPPLLLYLWLELALRRSQQQEDMDQLPANPRQGNQFIGYVEILSEQVEPLFGGGLL